MRKRVRRNCCGFWEPDLLVALAGLAILIALTLPIARKANQPGWIAVAASVGIWIFLLRLVLASWSAPEQMAKPADGSWRGSFKRLLRQLSWLGCLAPAFWFIAGAILQGPALITQKRLPELHFVQGDLGWTAKLPRTGPQLFNQNLTVEIHTRQFRDSPWILPPVSQQQADLLRRILPALPALANRAESALIEHGGAAPTFGQSLRRPRIWLDPIRDDGLHWSIIVEQKNRHDASYHVEFSNLDFQEVWLGTRPLLTIP